MSASRLLRAALVTGAVAGLATGCGSSSKSSSGGGAPSGGSSAGDTITIKDFSYNDLTVKAGTTVTVVNKDSAAHTVTADDKSFDSKVLAKDKTATITAPSKAGTYTYFCTIHNYMKGKLTVTG